MDRALAHFPTNPEYGLGIYRRRLNFVADARSMTAQVDDTHHSYWLLLEHDAVRVTNVEAGFMRAPNTTCPGVTAGLAALIGLPVDTTASEALARLPRSASCTHLSDLFCWTLAQIGQTALWEISIPDQLSAPVWFEVARNKVIGHRWQVANRHIVAPVALRGRPLMQGFMAWARSEFGGEDLIAATMLQRGLLVARGREHIVDQGDPTPLARAEGMAGSCWSYSGDRLSHATGTLNYVRDFTAGVTPETPPPHIAARLQGAGS